MSEHQQTESITPQVLAYLKAHPEASDTAEGIGRRWLTERFDAKALAAALDCLVESGILEWESGSDGTLRYRKAKRGR